MSLETRAMQGCRFATFCALAIYAGVALLVLTPGRSGAQSKPILAIKSDTAQPSVHVILGADPSADGTFVDRDNFESLFLAHVAKSQVSTAKLGELTQERILGSVRGLRVRPADTIVFFYAGHGFFDTSRNDHALFLPDRTSLYRSDLRNALIAHKCRLIVLVTDTCSGYYTPIRRKETPIKPQFVIQPPEPDELFRTLLFEHSGFVDISGSKPGQYGWGLQTWGGIFTHSLCAYLRSNKNQQMNWNSVIEKVKTETQQFFDEQFPDGAKAKGGEVFKEQTPYAFSVAAHWQSQKSGISASVNQQ